jgi:glycosyltransferase involved in cell wall biosynthesis
MFTLSVFSRILQRIPDAILVFVGDGELMKVIRKKSHDLGLDGSIRFLGYRDDVADLYQSFDVLMFPSYYEGLPLTGVEAQASGVPIVASTQISNELDVIPLLVNRISLSETAYAWEEKIESVAVHTIDDRKSFSKQLFNAGYSIHSSSMDLLEWYLRIVDEKGGHIEI